VIRTIIRFPGDKNIPKFAKSSQYFCRKALEAKMAIVAVASGTGGFGRAIVEAIVRRGKHNVKILSRKVLFRINDFYISLILLSRLADM
jgi:2-hydroxy-3-keto-5-methylthiopentenyl-1-phosphate phosphatase